MALLHIVRAGFLSPGRAGDKAKSDERSRRNSNYHGKHPLVITLFVLIAEVLEDMTVSRGRRAISDLLELCRNWSLSVRMAT